jgi:hypothetical protein
MNKPPRGRIRPELCGKRHLARPRASRDPGRTSTDGAAPLVQAWRAWADCGDGSSVHLILDPRAQQVWLLPADDGLIHPRSMS